VISSPARIDTPFGEFGVHAPTKIDCSLQQRRLLVWYDSARRSSVAMRFPVPRERYTRARVRSTHSLD
jgi:hypothetical protein